MSRKRVLITLPVDAYRRLAEMAEDEERVIDQQASLLLKRLLLNTADPTETSPGEALHESVPNSVVGEREGGLS
jgi:hypothetical protein